MKMFSCNQMHFSFNKNKKHKIDFLLTKLKKPNILKILKFNLNFFKKNKILANYKIMKMLRKINK